MASFGAPPVSLRHGVRLVAQAASTVEQVLLAVGEQVGHVNISYASRMNKAVVVFLKDQKYVTELIESGLMVNEEYIQVSPLATPSTRITVSGVPPFIPNEALERELKRFVVQGQHGWGVTYSSPEVCAVKGSTVEMSCSFTYPSRWGGGENTLQNTFWFTKKKDGENTLQNTFWLTKKKDGEYVDLTTVSEYAGRVEYLCSNHTCTLRIRNLRESDAAVYNFRIKTNQDAYWGYPGPTLSVTDLQVEVSRSGSSPRLQCLSSCPPGHTSYIWFKNGQEVKEDTSPHADFRYGSADSYSCALKGLEDFPSPSVYAPKPPSVSVSPSAEIEEGSPVTLTCSSDANPAANYTWYKEDSPKASGQIFNITDFRAEHRGSYSCGAQNKLGRSDSTLTLSVGTGGSWKLPAAATITVVLLAVIALSVFLGIRRKRASRDSSEPEERADTREEPEQQDDLQYASVHFSNSRADPLYSNMRAARPLGHTEQQDVPEYAAIKFSSAAPRTRGQDSGEDPAAFYSTVNKSH
ncbi:sialic acid-binding Ig-like lectin 14 isoform X3 [Pseudochaenichthys georgianus]|uniref:sialic acid-binding Ig-like lectin 14 isoform X3 n=1 Tax=Pseudochaenichthys georgianus TaxID=52239 RepID=UPI0039C258D9